MHKLAAALCVFGFSGLAVGAGAGASANASPARSGAPTVTRITNDAPSGDCTVSSVCNPAGAAANLWDWDGGVPGRYIIKSLPAGTGLYINCWHPGYAGIEPPAGPWGQDGVWDYVSWTSTGGSGWVDDNYVYDGSTGWPSWTPECDSVFTPTN